MEYSHKAIVIGGDHHNTLGVVRSLGEKGIRPYVLITTAKDKSFVSKSKYIETYWHIDENEDLVIKTLVDNFNNEKYKPVIITCSDKSASIIDNNLNKLDNYFICSSINHVQGKISQAMDKCVMEETALKSGFLVPKTWKIPLNDRNINLDEIIFPCIIKPILSYTSKKEDINICRNTEEFNLVINDYIRKKYGYAIVQEYIQKDVELSMFSFRASDGSIVCTSIIKKIIECPKNSGGTVFGRIFQNVQNYVDYQSLENFFKINPYTGIFGIEFFLKNNDIYFNEINYRNDGLAFLSTLFGANIPYEYYLSCISNEYNCNLKIKREGYFILETKGLINVFKRNLSFLKFVSCLFKADAYLIWNKKDIKPFIYKFLYR